MPRPYPPEFRARAIALIRAGRQARQAAVELGIHPVTLSKWLRQDDIDNGRPEPGGIVHTDHGTQFTSWVFGERIRSAGLLPSFGTVGDGLDNAMMESFWSSMQIEPLNRKRWKTRVELANAIFEFIEIFYNRQRRHSALGYRTPIEYEPLSENDTIPAAG